MADLDDLSIITSSKERHQITCSRLTCIKLDLTFLFTILETKTLTPANNNKLLTALNRPLNKTFSPNLNKMIVVSLLSSKNQPAMSLLHGGPAVIPSTATMRLIG